MQHGAAELCVKECVCVYVCVVSIRPSLQASTNMHSLARAAGRCLSASI